MYLGATVLLPSGYNADNKDTRCLVLYHQNHWDTDRAAYDYPADEKFAREWESGLIPSPNATNSTGPFSNVTSGRPTPKLILVQFRHEAPSYDDS